MSRPTTQLLWMVVGLVAAGGVIFLLWDRIAASFLHNPALNTGILVVLLVGIVFVFYQVARLTSDINWIEGFQRGGHTGSFAQPRLLAPLAAMVKDKQHNRLSLSATTLRSVLDGIQARLDEHREISRYLITLAHSARPARHVLGSARHHQRRDGGDHRARSHRQRSGRVVRRSEEEPARPAGRHGHRLLRFAVRSRRISAAGLSRSAGRPGATTASSAKSRTG